MQDVCQRILASGLFAGRQFSSADDYISEPHKGGMDRATALLGVKSILLTILPASCEIGTIKGMSFLDVKVSDPADQFSLFNE